MDVKPKDQPLVPLAYLTVDYKPVEGTSASLEALDFDRKVMLQGDKLTDYGGIDEYAPKRFKVTQRDGTQYVINTATGIESITDQYGHSITYDNTGIHHSSGASITFERGEGNRIERITDAAGRVVEYYYNEDGYLEKVVQIGGATGLERMMSQYDYGERKALFGGKLDQVLKSITAPDGTEVGQFEYDFTGRMTGLIDVNGNRVIYGYDVPNHKQTITDRLGNVTLYEYDNKGNVTRKTDPMGNVTQWEYDGQGNMLRETLPNGAVTVKTYYNGTKDIETETDALGCTNSFTYDTAGRVLTKTDCLGRVFTTERDANGNPVKEYGPDGNTVWSSYDVDGNLLTQKDMNGIVTAFAYNEKGSVTQTSSYRESAPDKILSKSASEYDAEGNPVRSVQYVNIGEADEGTIITSSEYDEWGNLIRETTPAGTNEYRYDLKKQKIASANHFGQWTHYVYDELGKLIKTIMPDDNNDNDGDPQGPGFDPAALNDNPCTASSYDAEGRMLTSTDVFGNVVTYVYDVNGNRLKTIYPDATESRQEYDEVGNVTAMIDRLGNTTRYKYDLKGQEKLRIDALNNQWIKKYDPVGNRIESIDPLNHLTQYKYDDADRLIKTIYPDNSWTSSTYDLYGNVTSETDQAGRTTWMVYNELNQLVEVRLLAEAGSSDVSITKYEYDSMGHKVGQIDALGRRTSWTYDIYGRMISHTLPEGQKETFIYLPDGRKESHTDFNGQVTTYHYDSRGRLTGQYWMDGVNDDTPDITYQYDMNGRITEAAKGRVTVKYAYDNVQKTLASLIYPGIGRIDYEYDALGRRTALTTTTGPTASPRLRRVDYSYDPLSRIETVNGAHGITQYEYNEVGSQKRMVTTIGDNSLITEYGYNTLDRITSINMTNGAGTTIASYNYSLDKSGMVMSVQEHGGRMVNYTYDNLARLLTETVTETGKPDNAWAFIYDKVGNRKSQVRPDGEVISYAYDDNDRLLSESSTVNGLTSYTYNPNGELVGKSSLSETATYTYDYDGRLVGAMVNRGGGGGGGGSGSGGVLDAIYEYDHNGNRVRRTTTDTDSGSTQDISMLVDPCFQFAQVLEEQDDNGNLVAAYTYGNDLISQQRVEGLSYYHHDRIGSVRMLTDAAGNVLNDYTYEAYGEAIEQNAMVSNLYKYTGEQEMPELGWYYLRARNYMPRVGRFVSLDPFEGVMTQPLTLNKYGYTEGRPTTFIDPSGEFTYVGALMIVAILELTELQTAPGTPLDGYRAYVVQYNETIKVHENFYNWIIANREKSELSAKGYRVIHAKEARYNDVFDMLHDLNVKAFVYIGHGIEPEDILRAYREKKEPDFQLVMNIGSPIGKVDIPKNKLFNIVHLYACYSYGFKKAFNTLDFVGYKYLVKADAILEDLDFWWQK